MMPQKTYSQSHAKRMAFRSSEAPRTNFVDREVVLHGGRVSDVFTVDGYVLIHGMFMRITEAVTNSACNMAWIYDPKDGGVQTDMGANVAIADKAIGITYYLELDGTAIVEVAANAVTTGVMNNITTTGRGMIVPPGGIDVKLSASKAMLAGKGQLFIQYEPITAGAKIWPGDMHSTTSSTSSTASTTSSTSSTASTSSSTSSTSSSTTTTAP